MSSDMAAASSTIDAIQPSVPGSQSDDPSPTASSASSTLTADEEALQLREKITNDLRNWQEKFAKAADKGTEDLEERVKEITDRQIESQAHGVGEALVIQLEDLAHSELSKLKRVITNTVKSLSEDPSEADIEKAEKDVVTSVRNAGLNVKSKAQSIRSWKQVYEQETVSLVTAASESTLEVIDNIRDLGLQEIGMRWAWMEGVTYKDWSKYHGLKKTFDEWRIEVEAVAKDHPGLQRSRVAAEEIESKGMSVAENTAKELARLKEVGKWKIQARDKSDDFTTKIIPVEAAVAGQKIKNKIKSANGEIWGTSQGTVESILSQASQQAGDVFSAASSQISGGVSGTSQPKLQSVVSVANRKANQAATEVSEAIVGTPAPFHESVASEASRSVESAVLGVSEVVLGSSKPLSGSASDLVESATASASSIASQASKKVFAGAMAQKVEAREPVFDDIINDDDETYSQKLQSIVNQAGDKYADVTKAVSEAMFIPTSTQGSIKSLTSVASDRYSSALEAASSILYGTSQGTGESIAGAASGKYAEAVAM